MPVGPPRTTPGPPPVLVLRTPAPGRTPTRVPGKASDSRRAPTTTPHQAPTTPPTPTPTTTPRRRTNHPRAAITPTPIPARGPGTAPSFRSPTRQHQPGTTVRQEWRYPH